MLPQQHQNYRILTTLALGLFFYDYENVTSKHFLKDKNNEDFPGSPRLRFPSQGSEIPHAKWQSQNFLKKIKTTVTGCHDFSWQVKTYLY